MALDAYRKKRNFRSTPEPRDDAQGPATPPGKRRFVVQLHAATQRHYDFRLEIAGVLKSWAVPKGPSMDPMERRLAVETEDHPIAYSHFEGIIPPGNYGAGTVMIWDEGTFVPRSMTLATDATEEQIDAELTRAYAKGHVTIVLEGQKLKGEFAIVRLPKGGATSWLLVKKHDRLISRAEITHEDRSARSGRTLGEIAVKSAGEGNIWLPKRGRVGLPEGESAKKALPPPKDEFGNERPPKRSRALPKTRDGSDEGLLLSAAPAAARPAKGGAKAVAALLAQAEVREEPMRVVPLRWKAAREAPSLAAPIVHVAWDGYRATAWNGARGAALIGQTIAALTKKFPEVVGALAALGQRVALDGLVVPLTNEGAPRRKGRAEPGRPVMHAFFAYDVLHLGDRDLRGLTLAQRLAILASLGLREDRGALRLGAPWSVSAAEDRELPEGAVGLLVRDGDALAPDAAVPGASAGALVRDPAALQRPTTVAPSRAATKPPPSSRAPTPKPTPAAAPPQVEPSRGGGSVYSVVSHRLPKHAPQLASPTNLGKVFWPVEGYTKGDLIAYYKDVAPVMVPHLIGRPQSLNRHPNGIEAASFFQKETAGHVPRWIETATIASGRSGKTITYMLCQNAETLLFLANLGCIEINVWPSRVASLNQPDYVVIDLDPGKIAFDEVITAARTVRAVLDELEVPSFVKTSGSRGLHIFVPIERNASYDATRRFAGAVCVEVQRRLPRTTTLDKPPKRRPDQIYLDWLQNRIGSTMAAIYSVRPKPGATCSVPLAWSEVKKGFDPTQFTLKTVRARLDAKGDLWATMDDARCELAAAQERLETTFPDAKPPSGG